MGLSWWAAGPFVYVSLLVCVIGTITKLMRYNSMPRHLRWELYPVPHQGETGSKYQFVDGSDRKKTFSKKHEFMAMLAEMIWIKKAYDNNRKLWYGSFPLHIGLYLSAGWLVMLVITEAIGLFYSQIKGMALINLLTVTAGGLGLSLGLFGCLFLLWLRLTDRGLRLMSDIVTYYNLFILIFLFGTSMLAWLFVDPGFLALRAQISALLVFNPSAVHPLVGLQLFSLGIFLSLLPFSRMMHYAAKFFFYHKVLWDDEAVIAGGTLEKELAGYLNYKPSWSGDHLKRDKTWLEQVQPGQVKADE